MLIERGDRTVDTAACWVGGVTDIIEAVILLNKYPDDPGVVLPLAASLLAAMSDPPEHVSDLERDGWWQIGAQFIRPDWPGSALLTDDLRSGLMVRVAVGLT